MPSPELFAEVAAALVASELTREELCEVYGAAVLHMCGGDRTQTLEIIDQVRAKVAEVRAQRAARVPS